MINERVLDLKIGGGALTIGSLKMGTEQGHLHTNLKASIKLQTSF